MAFVIPIFALLVTGIVQYSTFFFLKGSMGDVSREAARAMAVGTLTQSAAEAQVQAALINWGTGFNVTAIEPGASSPNQAVVAITVPLASVAFVDYLGLFSSGTIETHVSLWSNLQ